METTLWLRRLFTCIILCLLTCNLAYLTIDYVRYETDTNVAPYFPVTLNATKLSLCFSISSLLDRWPHGYSFSSDRNIKYINWTFDEVFRRMPSASSTLDSCKYRDFDLDILREEKDGKKCAELFKVIRYRMQGYICYRFTFPLDQEYSFHRLVNSLYNPRELYHLSIAQPLSNQHIFYPLLHLDEFPDDDRVFNGETYHEYGSLFQLSYDLVESFSLLSPYDTRCAPESRFTCYQKCSADVQRRLGYSPDSDLTMENSSASSLRLIPLEVNAEPERVFCYKKCIHEACIQFLVNTRFNKVKNPNDKFLIVIETVNTLITKILHLPKVPFIDFITQVGAVVSIWTGISVITLSRLIHPPRKVPLKTFFLAIKSHFTAVRFILSSRQMRNVRNDALSLEKKRLATKLKRVSVWANIFRMSLLPVLSWQLFNVIGHYFLFQTTTKFAYDLNPPLDIPTFGFCFDYKILLKDHLAEATEENYDRIFSTYHSITLKQMLDISPSTDELMEGCYIRDWKSRFKWFHYKNGSQCLEHFSVRKFYSNKKLCYQVLPRESFSNSTHQSDIKLLLTNPAIAYSIMLASNFRLSEKLYMFTSFNSEHIPRTPIQLHALVYKSDTRKKIISLSNRSYKFQMLPAPYDTSCDQTLSKQACLDACTSKLLSRYNRLPYGVTENRRLDMQFLSYSDLLNDSISKTWRQTELFCDQKCQRNFCRFSLTMTFVESRFPEESLQSIFAVDLPSHPTVEMETVPVMTMKKFVYEILCCLSFWLGVSLIDLKPRTASMRQKIKMEAYLTLMYVVIDKVVDKLLRLGSWSSYVQSVQRFSRRKLLDLCLRYSVVGLCFCHLIHSMVTYMSYSSFIDVYERMETRTDTNLHICLDSAELISRKFPSRIKDPVLARSVIMNRTISSIFADTPREDELIRECGHWGLYSRMANMSQLGHVSDRIFFSTKNKSICNHVYKVHKFILQSYMCYSIWPRYYTKSQIHLKHALNKQKLILKVAINSSLLTRRLSFVVNFEKDYPIISSTFAHNILRDPNHGHYDVSYIRYIQSILPSPKTTEGFVPFQYDRCLRACVNEEFQMFNLSLSHRFTGPSNLRFVSYLDRERNPLKIPFRQIQNKCEVGCLEYNKQLLEENIQEFTLFVPIVEGVTKKNKSKGEVTTISLRSTNRPVSIIIFTLKVSFFHQIINLGSILGLWFGFSAVTFARIGRIRDKEIGLEELLVQKQRIRVLKAKYRIR